MVVIDGTNSILGRMASDVARKLMKGEEVKIVNAEKIIITGNPDNIINSYLEKKNIGSSKHGPFFPRKPDMIVRRAVRGMMPYKTKKGREALGRLRVYENMPQELSSELEKTSVVQSVKSEFITIGKLSKLLGR
jgi:large subunit ribosomal protein L13